MADNGNLSGISQSIWQICKVFAFITFYLLFRTWTLYVWMSDNYDNNEVFVKMVKSEFDMVIYLFWRWDYRLDDQY